jgi:hypothetical protein
MNLMRQIAMRIADVNRKLAFNAGEMNSISRASPSWSGRTSKSLLSFRGNFGWRLAEEVNVAISSAEEIVMRDFRKGGA